MKLYNILENILLEATPDEIYQKYYSSFDKNIFDTIVKADPKTYTDENGNIKKIGAFSKLLLKLYKKNPRLIEDLENATQYLNIVYKKRVPIDINKINDLADLYEKIKIYFTKSNLNLNNVLDLLTINEDYKLLFKNDEWSLFKPLNEMGSCYLGFNTAWCTAWGKYSLNDEHKSKTNQFNHYGKDEGFFIIINNIDNDEKYQIHLRTNQFNISNDKNLSYSQRINVFEKLPKEIKYIIFPYTNPNNKIQLDDPISKLKIINRFLPNEDRDIFIDDYLLNVDYENLKNTELIDAINNKNKNITEIFKNYFDNIYDVFISYNNKYLKFDVPLNYVENSLLKKHFNILDEFETKIQYIDESEYGSNIDLEPFLKNFYENYKDDINRIMMIKNYQQFNQLSEPFKDNDRVKEYYCEQMYEVNVKQHLEDLNNQYEIPNLYLTQSFNSYQINVDSNLLQGILGKYDIEHFKKNIVNVVDEIIKLFDNDYDLDVYQDYYDNMYRNVPSIDFLNNIFDDILNDLEDEYINDVEENGGCKVNAIKKINQLFPTYSDIDNEYYTIKKPDFSKIYCENNQGYIYLEIYDKKNNKDLKGDVMVDNIVNYIQNIPLDLKESLLKNFKRFI